jgi:transposase
MSHWMLHAMLLLIAQAAKYALIQASLQATGVLPAETLIVLEATGSYWVRLAASLHSAGFVVSVVNPAQVHS